MIDKNTLEAGPDTDKLVINTVFGGIPRGFRCPACGSSHFGTLNPLDPQDQWIRDCHDEFNVCCSWKGKLEDAPIAYSSDERAVWGLLNELRGQGWWFSIHVGHDQIQVVAHTHGKSPNPEGIGRETEFPLAVCKAVLDVFDVFED